jgi:PPOX class probable F420-dependent enzyme
MATGLRLSDEQRAFLAAARTATLATIADVGSPRLVPVCFVVGAGSRGAADVIYTPLDEKPKHVDDVRELARVRDIRARPAVVLLVDRWSEDWSELGWLRLAGRATLLEPGDAPEKHKAAVAALRAKYPQYASHRLDDRPLIRIVIEKSLGWGRLRRDTD